ncbi:MAG: nucleoside hydrolase [Leptolyngbyaceae cyanobacterium SM1_1_3]|nr:nucleoside hydrolase [Leptolyngbyaceae cyanobacterium SM1_1_3]NJN02337.1 nucleoside hydrolase [Leptolyngbyaceae cyanobacterium RM1_1_2]NJO11733.1 nucleoside hydrolase [Leptolyngbyaceae cyanobacterium SL_1_1]
MPLPLIIDCDPGVDDAIALLMALASPEFDLLGITTVAGNVPLALTAKNARKICQLAGRTEIDIYAGCPRPLLRPLVTAEQVHGSSGLEGADLPEPTVPLRSPHAVSFLIEQLTTAQQPITLAALGPLTNIAVALIQQPQILQNLQELVIMGGAIAQGNVTASAEFNFYVDPHAARVVFESGAKLTLISLDVTHQALTTPERLANIRAIGSPVSKAAADLLAYYGVTDAVKYGLPGAPLHDPCVIAYLLQPNLFTAEAAAVVIETQSELTLGRSVVNFQPVGAANARVMRTIRSAGFYQLLIERLERYVS